MAKHINKAAEYCVKLLREYAEEMQTLPRGTTDMSPLEQWLVMKLYNKSIDISYNESESYNIALLKENLPIVLKRMKKLDLSLTAGIISTSINKYYMIKVRTKICSTVVNDYDEVLGINKTDLDCLMYDINSEGEFV